ncbi:hypothetical protein BDQ17DRAFT_1362807 [Cyathus striatus]|nr:hypothetical protein BDQ17DRAFT_1362807 [Cyathus striatus]
MPTQCSICLSEYNDPVSIPCGHIYCTKCLSDHVNVPTNQGFTSTCPTCRAPFNTLKPDLTYLPRKYHQYVLPSVRRVYPAVIAPPQDPAHLKEKVRQLEARIVAHKLREEQLLKQCERYHAAVLAHREGERNAIVEAREWEEQLEEAKEELDEVKEELDEVKLQLESVEDDLREAEEAKEEAEEEKDDTEIKLQEMIEMCDGLELRQETEIASLKDEIQKLKKKNTVLKQQLQYKERERPAPTPAPFPVQLPTPERPSLPAERKVRPLPKRLSHARSPSPGPSPGELRMKKPRIEKENEYPIPCLSCGRDHGRRR